MEINARIAVRISTNYNTFLTAISTCSLLFAFSSIILLQSLTTFILSQLQWKIVDPKDKNDPDPKYPHSVPICLINGIIPGLTNATFAEIAKKLSRKKACCMQFTCFMYYDRSLRFHLHRNFGSKDSRSPGKNSLEFAS